MRPEIRDPRFEIRNGVADSRFTLLDSRFAVIAREVGLALFYLVAGALGCAILAAVLIICCALDFVRRFCRVAFLLL